MGQMGSNRKSSCERVLFIGIGDLLHRDRGIGLHLLRDLKECTAQEEFIFLNLSSGASLYEIIQSVKAKKIFVFESGEGEGHPGELAIIRISRKVTFFFVEPFDIRRGNRLSRFIRLKYPYLLNAIKEIISKDLKKEGLQMTVNE